MRNNWRLAGVRCAWHDVESGLQVKENFSSVIKSQRGIADIHKYLLRTEIADAPFRCTRGVMAAIADVSH